ncbi:MAG: phosphopantetheine-binding protein, partial [Pseudoxanthomonas sp.]
AYVVPQPGETLQVDELRAYLRRSLPDYMVPGAFVQIAQVPVTHNGKVDRKALPALTPSVQASRGNLHQALRTPTEHKVAELWRELLEVEEVGLLDNFLDLGGHSLLVMRAVALLETRTGARLSPRAFVFQTLEQIAAECDALSEESASVETDAPAKLETQGFLKRVMSRFGRVAQK